MGPSVLQLHRQLVPGPALGVETVRWQAVDEHRGACWRLDTSITMIPRAWGGGLNGHGRKSWQELTEVDDLLVGTDNVSKISDLVPDCMNRWGKSARPHESISRRTATGQATPNDRCQHIP